MFQRQPKAAPWTRPQQRDTFDKGWSDKMGDGLLERFSASDYRPPALPAVAQKVVRLSNDMNATFDQFCEVIQEDPMLAARIVRISRSALYSRRGEIRSVQQAILRLGIEQLRDIVIEDVLNMHVFRCREYQGTMERLRVHSIATAHVARKAAESARMQTEFVFLCGLLHDIGIAVALLAIADQVRPRPTFLQIRNELNDAHPRLSSALATMWELPGEVHAVVACHHDISARGFPDRLSAAVCIGEHLVNERGMCIDARPDPEQPFDHSSPFHVEQARMELGLSDDQWEALGHAADDVIDNLRQDASGPAPT